MAARVTAKSTKAEIIEAFEELKKEKITLETQLKKLEKEKKSEPEPTSNKVTEKEAIAKL